MNDTFDYLSDFEEYGDFEEMIDTMWTDFTYITTEMSLYHYPTNTDLNSLLSAYTEDSLLHLLDYGGYGYSIDRLKNYKKVLL